MTPALLERLNVYAEQHRWSRSTAAMALIESGLQREHGQPPEQAVVPGAH